MTPVERPNAPRARGAGDRRPLRADARRNRDRILAAAREVFAESGFGAPLDEIAVRAGVGPGTVYRAFPTKEALFQAVVTARVAGLAAEAQRRAADADPGEAFFAFLARLGAEGAGKRDLPDAIALPSSIRDELYEAVAVLLRRAQDSGAVRSSITVGDLMALFNGVLGGVHHDFEPGRAERIIAVLTDGLRPPHLP